MASFAVGQLPVTWFVSTFHCIFKHLFIRIFWQLGYSANYLPSGTSISLYLKVNSLPLIGKVWNLFVASRICTYSGVYLLIVF